VDLEQSLTDLVLGPRDGLVRHGDAAEGQAGRGARGEQFGAAGERERHCVVDRDRGLGHVGRCVVTVAGDEPAADGVVRLDGQLRAGVVERAESQRVRVPGQHRQRVLHDVAEPERDHLAAGEPQATGALEVLERLCHRVGIDRFGQLPGESRSDGPERAVALTRGRERAVQVDADRHHRQRCDALGELGRGPHGAHGVRARRADTDAEQIEDGDRHVRHPNPSGRNTSPAARPRRRRPAVPQRPHAVAGVNGGAHPLPA
jgi:hypothetical protein